MCVPMGYTSVAKMNYFWKNSVKPLGHWWNQGGQELGKVQSFLTVTVNISQILEA